MEVSAASTEDLDNISDTKLEIVLVAFNAVKETFDVKALSVMENNFEPSITALDIPDVLYILLIIALVVAIGMLLEVLLVILDVLGTPFVPLPVALKCRIEVALLTFIGPAEKVGKLEEL